jgi:hypothetical protein
MPDQTHGTLTKERSPSVADNGELLERIHRLEVAQSTQAAAAAGAEATQAATQAGAAATGAASVAGVAAAVIAGGASLIVGIVLGMAIAKNGRS